MPLFKKTATSHTRVGVKYFLSVVVIIVFAVSLVLIYRGVGSMFTIEYVSSSALVAKPIVLEPKYPPLDKKAYDRKIFELALGTTTIPLSFLESWATSTVTATTTGATTQGVKKRLWPVKAPYPVSGAVLPFKRIVAYYGNYYSTAMGALGQDPPDVMLSKLAVEVKKWQEADPNTEVVPALHYIAVTAQGSPGVNGLYRLRMPDSEIEKTLKLAKQINGLVFLDIQVGLSTIKDELPEFDVYLKNPDVHIGVDPEFYMKTKQKPGNVVGSMDAEEINYVIDHLAQIVKDNNLPPKILVIHRFTMDMVTNYKKIKIVPEVQVVMDMDGWGSKARKLNTYQLAIRSEPVLFTGFKLFYKNDLKEGGDMMTPKEVLELRPQPVYIQYQ